MLASDAVLVERAATCRESGDGEEEVGGLRWIIGNPDRLAFALRREETGIAAFPSVKLPIEKVAPSGVILQRREMEVDTGDEACRAVSCRPGNLARNALSPSIQCHCMAPSRTARLGISYIM